MNFDCLLVKFFFESPSLELFLVPFLPEEEESVGERSIYGRWYSSLRGTKATLLFHDFHCRRQNHVLIHVQLLESVSMVGLIFFRSSCVAHFGAISEAFRQ